MLRHYTAACLLAFLSFCVEGNPLELSYDNATGQLSGHTGFPPCDALIDAGLGNRLLLATDESYEARIESWWALNSRIHPWCLVQPHNTKEVSKTLSALKNAGDGAGSWHIAVRSGGHSVGDMSNIDSGVTVDMGMMNSTSYDSDTNLAKIQPGAKWMNVYADLLDHDVMVFGGRDGDVGVGGFLLGGGLTYTMGRRGWACDSVINYEVVLADGSIVNANESSDHADLWRGLRGGGANFGIVTRFDLDAMPANDLALTSRTMSFKHSDEVLNAVLDFTDIGPNAKNDALYVYYTHNTAISPQTVIGSSQVNTLGDKESPNFDEFNSIPPLSPELVETSVASLADAAKGSQLAGGLRSFGMTLTFKNDLDLLHYCAELHEEFVTSLSQVLEPDKFSTMFFLQPLPAYYSDVSRKRGGNMLGLEKVYDNAIIWTGGVQVDGDDADLALARTLMSATAEKMEQRAASTGGNVAFRFMNYGAASQDVLGSYGSQNVEYIRQVATKYDPDGVFQERIPGGFKISRVD